MSKTKIIIIMALSTMSTLSTLSAAKASEHPTLKGEGKCPKYYTQLCANVTHDQKNWKNNCRTSYMLVRAQRKDNICYYARCHVQHGKCTFRHAENAGMNQQYEGNPSICMRKGSTHQDNPHWVPDCQQLKLASNRKVRSPHSL